MIADSGSRHVLPQVPESMTTLAGYLAMLLFKGGCLVMMQQCEGVCGMYAGRAGRSQEELHYLGAVEDQVADDILRISSAGRNKLDISGTFYHCFRAPAHFEARGAVVFHPV